MIEVISGPEFAGWKCDGCDHEAKATEVFHTIVADRTKQRCETTLCSACFKKLREEINKVNL